MKRRLTMFAVVAFILLLAVGCGNEPAPEPKPEQLVDVNQFARVAPDALSTIMGEPDSTETWNNQTSKGTFPVTTYFYQNGKYEFLVIDNMVVRMNIHSDKYNNKDAESIKYTTEESILDMLNIDSSDERIEKIADTGMALRFSPVSDTVADVWCSLMDQENQTIDEIKVTFNLNYFD